MPSNIESEITTAEHISSVIHALESKSIADRDAVTQLRTASKLVAENSAQIFSSETALNRARAEFSIAAADLVKAIMENEPRERPIGVAGSTAAVWRRELIAMQPQTESGRK